LVVDEAPEDEAPVDRAGGGAVDGKPTKDGACSGLVKKSSFILSGKSSFK
jgi:hypothetical protein